MLRRALFSADIAIRIAFVVIYMLRLVNVQMTVYADMPMLFGILFPFSISMNSSFISAINAVRIANFFIRMHSPARNFSANSTCMPVIQLVIHPFLAGFMRRICSLIAADIAVFIAVIRVFMVCGFVSISADGTIAVMLVIAAYPSVSEFMRCFSFVAALVTSCITIITVYMLCFVFLAAAYSAFMPVLFFI